MVADDTKRDKVVTDLKRVVHDSEELLADSAGMMGQKAQELRERLTRTLDSAKEAYHRLEDKAKSGAKATDKAIRQHPYPALGAAFGLGILIGVLLRRR